MTRETVEITGRLRLRCYVHQEGRFWVSYCPSLDLSSQGDTREEARDAVSEAAQLWFDSCVERGTLAEALAELGWHAIPPGKKATPDMDTIEVAAKRVPSAPRGEEFEVDVTIPAYQAAALLQAQAQQGAL